MSAVMAEPAADAAPIRRPRKKILIVGAAVLALVLALAAGTVVFLKQRAARAAAAGDDEVATEQAGSSHIDPKNVPVYLPLDPFIVNLADREADRYAQIGITLEVDSNASSEQIKAFMPAIRNAILLILANKTSKELLNREGKEQLAQEILREAARPMGIEVPAPEPVTPAPGEGATSAATAASAPASAVDVANAAAAKAKALRRNPNAPRNPIQHVHFSSFIIQ
jgi:Flagellar basal body-associated protein